MKRPGNARREILKTCDVKARTFIALDTDGDNDICIWKDDRYVYADMFGMSVVTYVMNSDGSAKEAKFQDMTERLMSFRGITKAFNERVSNNVKENIEIVKRRIGA